MKFRAATSSRQLIVRFASVALVASLWLSTVSAAAPEPHVLVSDVIERVMSRLGEAAPGAENQDTALLALFEEELSPHFAFGTISRWIAGKRWDTLSPAERAELEAVVHDHIVHAYASLLARGHSATIRIDSQNSRVGTKSARVGGVLALPQGQDLALEFRLLRAEADWKLYDLAVDGLSFARSLRAELNPVLLAEGIEGLRAYLARYQ